MEKAKKDRNNANIYSVIDKHYRKKSQREAVEAIVNGCVIIPQAHLSMFLDHEIKGQSWKAAFARINGKSVDFLICTNDMKPLIAIELDDNTHNQPDRKTRDDFVNSIIANTNMPLLRFKAGEWNSEIIKHRITQALSQN